MIYQHFISPENNAKILIWEITETEEELITSLANFKKYEPEFTALKNSKRKLEFLASRIALNYLAGQTVYVAYDTSGKPFLLNEKLHISISHSRQWVAVMLAGTNCGIDIECPTDKILKVYRRFLNDQEQRDLFQNTGDIVKLQLAWSAKEALYKIIGEKAVDFSGQLQIAPFEAQQEGRIEVVHLPANKMYELAYKVTPSFNLVYCTAN